MMEMRKDYCCSYSEDSTDGSSRKMSRKKRSMRRVRGRLHYKMMRKNSETKKGSRDQRRLKRQETLMKKMQEMPHYYHEKTPVEEKMNLKEIPVVSSAKNSRTRLKMRKRLKKK